jgi:hypothetical protein
LFNFVVSLAVFGAFPRLSTKKPVLGTASDGAPAHAGAIRAFPSEEDHGMNRFHGVLVLLASLVLSSCKPFEAWFDHSALDAKIQ